MHTCRAKWVHNERHAGNSYNHTKTCDTSDVDVQTRSTPWEARGGDGDTHIVLKTLQPSHVELFNLEPAGTTKLLKLSVFFSGKPKRDILVKPSIFLKLTTVLTLQPSVRNGTKGKTWIHVAFRVVQCNTQTNTIPGSGGEGITKGFQPLTAPTWMTSSLFRNRSSSMMEFYGHHEVRCKLAGRGRYHLGRWRIEVCVRS